MSDATYGRRNRQMEFRVGDLETARPRAVLAAVLRCGGAPAPLDVLLQCYAEESRDYASAGYERAT
jgi:hypothetical protein